MAELTITVNGRNYQVTCDDGQEAHLRQLASYIDKRVGELTAAMGQIGDARLLVMTSLLIADELADTYASLEEERKRPRGLAPDTEAVLAQGIEALAARIESIAARLEAT